MELVGKLKEQVENSNNIEEAKKLIEKAGMILSDEELLQVSGGGPHDDIQTRLANLKKLPGIRNKLTDLKQQLLNENDSKKFRELAEQYEEFLIQNRDIFEDSSEFFKWMSLK